ncbi:pseudouridine synthase [Paramicrobacterium agarici]|uniref:pseudouridine synthase n=1 Tax=Paramicrobacterium agarici TaxID=630514 RepID=UPI00114FAA6C|nr:pseudouridine synthase [Microbacterium agarici]TQO22350.1 tRNA pseudouridine32 synthase/23S rRNA pseudouridine746 synthase [Microbacterium agarici]
MPISPLPQRHGLDAAWVRTPRERRWKTLRQFLIERLPKLEAARIDDMLANGEFAGDDGRPFAADAPYRPHTFVWFHRDLREEVEVPFDIDVLHRDDRIVVIDKPHFLSTIPRGRHVTQSVVVKARRLLDLPQLVPAHRLDRVTAGVLLLTAAREWRGAYQTMFDRREVEKEYEAIANAPGDRELPATVRSHIVKIHGEVRAYEVTDREPNAETRIELIEQASGLARYRATPHTGKTHQIRLHMNALGLPIVNDPFYPEVIDTSIDDFSSPLQLLAKTLRFTDPVDGTIREFTSRRELAAWSSLTP